MGLYGAFDRRLNVVNQRRNVPLQWVAATLDGVRHRRDCAALGMTQHDQDGGVDVCQAILDGPDLIRVTHIARDADHEDIHHARIEEPLHRNARIGAGNDRGVGVVALVLGPRLEESG